MPLTVPALAAPADPGAVRQLVVDQVRRRLPGQRPVPGFERLVGGALVAISESVIAMPVRETKGEFATLGVTIRDPERVLIRSGVFGKPGKPPARYSTISAERKGYQDIATVDLQALGAWWRLDDVEEDGDGHVILGFMDRVAAVVMEFDRPLKASRNDVTRAGFVVRMAREPKTYPVQTVIPEVGIRQRIAAAPDDDSTSSSGELNIESGFAPGADVTVKGKRANAAQRRVLEDVLRAGRDLDWPTRRVLMGGVMAVTQESLAGQLTTSTSGKHKGPFHQDESYGPERDRQNAYRAGTAFFRRWGQRNGKNADGELGALIDKVQVSGNPAGFAQWEDEAARTVDEWQGESAGDASRTIIEPFTFRRGEPGGKRENTWQASGRLADEVGSSRTAVANHLLWGADEAFMKAKPALVVTPDTPGVTLRWKARRRRPALEATLTGLIRYLPCGVQQIVEVRGYGPPDGRWMVGERSWDALRLSEPATVALERPHRRLPEPAAERKTVSEGDVDSAGISLTGDLNDSKVAKVVREGIRISRRNLPYVWGGGHAKVGEADGGTGRDDGIGYDCSGYVGACAHAAGLWPEEWGDSVPGSGTFASSYGVPGKGKYLTIWANAGHVFYEVNIPGLKVRWIDTSRAAGGGAGPHVRYGDRSTAGFTPRHWPGT